MNIIKVKKAFTCNVGESPSKQVSIFRNKSDAVWQGGEMKKGEKRKERLKNKIGVRGKYLQVTNKTKTNVTGELQNLGFASRPPECITHPSRIPSQYNYSSIS